jgi:[ribosomal protein S5]-alanine N-acetyltransferase
VSWGSRLLGNAGPCFEIGIALLPDFRGRGIGTYAQILLADYLFAHHPVQRIQAGTHPENAAEQRSLVKAGFQFEGRLRAAEFRAGQWRDGLMYSRVRDDPAPR